MTLGYKRRDMIYFVLIIHRILKVVARFAYTAKRSCPLESQMYVGITFEVLIWRKGL